MQLDLITPIFMLNHPEQDRESTMKGEKEMKTLRKWIGLLFGYRAYAEEQLEFDFGDNYLAEVTKQKRETERR